jgi:hypothetical protein
VIAPSPITIELFAVIVASDVRSVADPTSLMAHEYVNTSDTAPTNPLAEPEPEPEPLAEPDPLIEP